MPAIAAAGGRGDGTLNMAVAATVAARQPRQPRRTTIRRGASLMMPDDAIATPIWPDRAVTSSHCKRARRQRSARGTASPIPVVMPVTITPGQPRGIEAQYQFPEADLRD